MGPVITTSYVVQAAGSLVLSVELGTAEMSIRDITAEMQSSLVAAVASNLEIAPERVLLELSNKPARRLLTVVATMRVLAVSDSEALLFDGKLQWATVEAKIKEAGLSSVLVSSQVVQMTLASPLNGAALPVDPGADAQGEEETATAPVIGLESLSEGSGGDVNNQIVGLAGGLSAAAVVLLLGLLGLRRWRTSSKQMVQVRDLDRSW